MSATGRGRARNPRDYYRTPAWCVEVLLEHESLLPNVYDPACGDGAILEVLQKAGHKVYGLDIDPGSALAASQQLNTPIGVGDYLHPERPHPCRCDVVMNPPYRQAAEFVRVALSQAEPRSRVCALLRLNFLGSSRKRLDLVGKGAELRRVIVLSRRPSFTGDGRTDACEYAWLVFEAGYQGPAEVVISG